LKEKSGDARIKMHARDTKEKTHVASKVSREGQQAKKINVKPVLIQSYYI
jgi:hypothetical protein